MTIALLPPLLAFLMVQTPEQPQPFSTCPSFEEAVKQNVAYVQVDTQTLMKNAKYKVHPETPKSCRCAGQVHVMVKVEGERVCCATALDGHPLLQEAAVKAAMQWRFRKNPQFSDVTGTLVFEFK